MIKWMNHTNGGNPPPRHRALLAYCPEWCDTGYAVVTWTGFAFECETHGAEITDHVEQWSLIFEAD